MATDVVEVYHRTHKEQAIYAFILGGRLDNCIKSEL